MAYLFELKISNGAFNQTQNVAGKFGSFAGTTFTGAVCHAGQLVVPHSLIPSEGYEGLTDYQGNSFSLLNGNTHYMVNAANGTSGGAYGDHTGIYACNSYDVNKATSGSNVWNIGANTRGLDLPANERGDFSEIIIGESYAFAAGNFSTLPADSTYVYATISNGFLVAATSAPAAGSGVYFEISPYTYEDTEGSSAAGTVYVLKAVRTAEA